MTGYIVSLFIAYGIGHMVVRIAASGVPRVLRICLSFGTGIGLTSCLYFWWLLSGACKYGFTAYFAAELLAIPVLYALGPRPAVKCAGGTAKGRAVFRFERKRAAVMVLTVILFVAALISSLAVFVIFSSVIPNGEWDAYSIWNLHARFMFRDPAAWKDMFNSALEWSHPDYPLLIPGSLARSWQYIGSEKLFAGQALSFLFVYGMITAAISAVWRLKGKMQGLLCGFALLSATYLFQYGLMQYADMPLAFYFTASVSAYLLYNDSRDNPRLLLLAGLMASLAAWTKNEGIAFFVIFALLLLILEKKRSDLKYFVAGALPVIITLTCFKITCSFSNDIFMGAFLDPGNLSRLTDPMRYLVLLFTLFNYSYFGGYIGKFGLLIYLAVVGISMTAALKKGLLFAALIYAAMAVVYFMIFVMTPANLEWLVTCSMNRIYAQLLPILLMLLFLAARPADEILSGGRN